MTLQEQFEKFHRENPAVYKQLVKLARQLKDKGIWAGIGHLWEVVRWTMWMETTGDQFTLNNNYRSRYARLIMAQEADLNGYFETRRLSCV